MNQWENAVITAKGLSLQAKLTQGNTLRITRAITGAGYVTPGLLQNQTDVSDPRQVLTFRAVAYPEPGKCSILTSMTNDTVDTGYTALQVGLYANDPDEGEILYLLIQAADKDSGTIIPAASEMPGFSAEWNIYFRYGQADTVNVTVDPSNTVSMEQLEGYINDTFVPLTTSEIDSVLTD